MNKVEITQMLKEMDFKIPDNHATLSFEELIKIVVKNNDEELTDEKWVKLGNAAFNKLFQDAVNSPIKKIKNETALYK